MKSGQLRRAMAAGIAFVVLFVPGVFLNFGDTPNIKSSDTNAVAAQKWVTELSSSGHRTGLIVSAYLLHNLYTAFENVFRNIAFAFENALDDRSGWHRQLLERMRLDLSPIRPAVIDDAAYVALDELLRFRHLFRSAYSARLDAGRLALVLRAAEELRPLYRPQIERFLEFVKAGG